MSDIDPSAGHADDAWPIGLDAVLGDLGVAREDVPVLGDGGPPGHHHVLLRPGQRLVGRTFAGIEEELGSDSLFLVHVPELADDRTLARWRDALWPLLHLSAIYIGGDSRTYRRTIGKGQHIDEGPPLGAAVVLAGRRRLHAMSPEATVEKFDTNAKGWDGEPGRASYPHFRWMRRHVGHFAPVADGARVLDFGSGAGWVGIEAAKSARGTSLRAFDPSPNLVEIATQNAQKAGITDFEARQGFGENPPFPLDGEEPFDHVVCSGVVSFAPELDPWLDGLARTVRPGGELVIGDIHPHSRGFRKRRRAKPLLPVRELNAHTREAIREGLEQRGFSHHRFGAYQLTWPIPELMHVNEKKLAGVLTHPLLWINRATSRVDRTFGSPLQDHFDSWVMHLTRSE